MTKEEIQKIIAWMDTAYSGKRRLRIPTIYAEGKPIKFSEVMQVMTDEQKESVMKTHENLMNHANIIEPMLQFFEFKHLPPHLQDVSRWFNSLAINIVDTLPRNPERTVALRKLLEAKDCAVRAVLYK